MEVSVLNWSDLIPSGLFHCRNLLVRECITLSHSSRCWAWNTRMSALFPCTPLFLIFRFSLTRKINLMENKFWFCFCFFFGGRGGGGLFVLSLLIFFIWEERIYLKTNLRDMCKWMKLVAVWCVSSLHVTTGIRKPGWRQFYMLFQTIASQAIILVISSTTYNWTPRSNK